MLRVATEVFGEAAEYGLDPNDERPGEARVRFSSRLMPGRRAGLQLDSFWLEAWFFIEPPVSVLKLDDFELNPEYTVEQVRELAGLIHAYLALWEKVTPDLRGVAIVVDGAPEEGRVAARLLYEGGIAELQRECVSIAEAEFAADFTAGVTTDFVAVEQAGVEN